MNTVIKNGMEFYPLGIEQVIIGDRRETTQVIDGEQHFFQHTSGTVIYDRYNRPPAPYFLIRLESGNRINK